MWCEIASSRLCDASATTNAPVNQQIGTKINNVQKWHFIIIIICSCLSRLVMKQLNDIYIFISSGLNIHVCGVLG